MSAKKKIAAVQNPKTGSYTVSIPKDARTGTFRSGPIKTGRIVISGQAKKAS